MPRAGAVARFPNATPRDGDDKFGGWAGLAVRQKVWEALRAIPAGATATDAEVAGRVGQPPAARAVAGACAADPVAVVVPCHQVVGRKAELLRLEGKGHNRSDQQGGG